MQHRLRVARSIQLNRVGKGHEETFPFTQMKRHNSPTITIGEARKVLGSAAATLNDDQILEIISTLSLLAKAYIRKTGSKK